MYKSVSTVWRFKRAFKALCLVLVFATLNGCSFLVPEVPEGSDLFIISGKEHEATPAQLKKIFGIRYTSQTVFQQSWVDNRIKGNLHKIHAFVLDVKGTNKKYNCLCCNKTACGNGKLKVHLTVPKCDLVIMIYHS
jgi:hypothetical protein